MSNEYRDKLSGRAHGNDKRHRTKRGDRVLRPQEAGVGREARRVEAPVAEGAPELDPLRRALQAMEENEMTPKEKRASLRQRGFAT